MSKYGYMVQMVLLIKSVSKSSDSSSRDGSHDEILSWRKAPWICHSDPKIPREF